MKFYRNFSRFLFATLVVSTVLASCSKSEEDEPIIAPPTTGVDTVLTGNIATRTLTADRQWILKGYVYVPNGVTLTIQAGTTIKSDTITKGALCVERGGKIMAEGSATQPIVFTSGYPAGRRNPGDWGGLVILGNARTNRTSTPVIEGGLDRPYGGTNDADNSGILRYVRVEYAGIAAFPNSEINSVTLGGVGSGTIIENVQSAYANDDAFEFYGGTVNCKNLISFATADDDFDFDFGYTGKIQFAFALRDPQWIDPGDQGNGIESDNDNPATTSQPYTRPEISNMTLIGSNSVVATAPLSNHGYGNRWRRNSRFVFRNSIIMGWPKAGFSVEQDLTAEAYNNGQSIFKNNIVQALAEPFRSGSAAIISAAQMETKALAEGNVKLSTANDVMLTAPFNLTAPNLLPASGSPALTGADFAGLDAAFFTNTGYRGAFGTSNWTSGWARFFAKGQ